MIWNQEENCKILNHHFHSRHPRNVVTSDAGTQADIVIEEMEDDVSQVKERMNNILSILELPEFQSGETDPDSDLSENEYEDSFDYDYE